MPVIRGALCCFSLTLIVAGCGSSVGVEVSRDETGDARFGLGEFNGRCEATASTDNVTYERRKEGDITYCKVTSLWSGTLLDMSEVREGVQQELDARGAPVNADQVDVTFTSLDVADVTVSMVKDGAPIAFPNLTYYAARAGVDGVAGILTANWPSADAAVNDPDVAFVDDVGGAGAKDALLEHMNANTPPGKTWSVTDKVNSSLHTTRRCWSSSAARSCVSISI